MSHRRLSSRFGKILPVWRLVGSHWMKHGGSNRAVTWIKRKAWHRGFRRFALNGTGKEGLRDALAWSSLRSGSCGICRELGVGRVCQDRADEIGVFRPPKPRLTCPSSLRTSSFSLSKVPCKSTRGSCTCTQGTIKYWGRDSGGACCDWSVRNLMSKNCQIGPLKMFNGPSQSAFNGCCGHKNNPRVKSIRQA